MLRIGFLLKDRELDHASPVMDEVIRILQQRRVHIERIIPARQLIALSRLEVSCDLYVLRPGVELALTLAGILHDKGARIVNSYEASAFTHDKARVTARLESAGIPTPRSFITGNIRRARACLAQAPVIVKPHRGSAGEGICVIRTEAEIGEGLRGPQFVQEYLPSDGEDLKVYVIGGEVFALKRPFPPQTYGERLGRPCAVDGSVRSLALRCGQILGLEIYGIDFLETGKGPVIVDVNYLPGMVGVPRAAELVAERLYARLRDSKAAGLPHAMQPPPVADAHARVGA